MSHYMRITGFFGEPDLIKLLNKNYSHSYTLESFINHFKGELQQISTQDNKYWPG